jgi:hypothetical protein
VEVGNRRGRTPLRKKLWYPPPCPFHGGSSMERSGGVGGGVGRSVGGDVGVGSSGGGQGQSDTKRERSSG